MKQFILLLFIISNLLAQSDKNHKEITLQLSWKNQFQFAGYYMAKEMGYYEDANLDVTIKEFEYGTNLTEMIEQKKAHFAIGRSSLLIDKANNKDVVALGAIFQNSPLVLVTTNENIKNIQDLKNKRIMITQDAKGSVPIIAMLSANGIKIENLTVQNHSFNLNDLIENKTDAMASYISNEPIILESKNIKYKVFNPKDYDFNFYSDILFTSSKFMYSNPKVTRDFYEASIKGWEYAFNNIGKTAKVIHDKYNTQNKSIVNLVSEAEALKKLVFHEKSGKIGCLEKEKLTKIVDIYKVMGVIHRNINLDEFIYEHNSFKQIKFDLSYNEILFIAIILLLIVLGLSSLIFYFTIKKKWLLTKKGLEDEVHKKTIELKEQTKIDFLTNIQNRKGYNIKIDELLDLNKRYHNPFSIALFDIDNFKQINDTYGHQVGDDVLKSLASLVKNEIRKTDYIFRIGGEEFIILFNQTNLQKAYIATEKIRENIPKELNFIKDRKITVSVGLTEVEDNDNEDTLYKRVDALMYKSKNSGKNKTSIF